MVQNWNDNLQKLLDNNKEEITFNSDYLIGNQNLYGKHFKSKIFSNKNATYNVYLFFSIDKRDEIVSYYNKVYTSYRNQLKNIKNINNKEINNYKKYLDFECDSKGNILSIKINIESYQKAIQNVGYFVVISNIEKTAQEIYEIYKNKNNTEKAFSEIKNYSQLNNNFDEYDNGLEAKTFITFLSLIVRNFILYKCKSFLENHPPETFNTIMDELRKIQLTKVQASYMRKYSLSNEQKEILKCLGISLSDISKYIEKVNEKS
ncbi:hypothetical protein [Mycoplasmopsis adleri]|uniref:hypothetical protein n=2 Tax=Mycoplasmopsis adleri TaxID=51362 RepID=UPI003872CBB6